MRAVRGGAVRLMDTAFGVEADACYSPSPEEGCDYRSGYHLPLLLLQPRRPVAVLAVRSAAGINATDSDLFLPKER